MCSSEIWGYSDIKNGVRLSLDNDNPGTSRVTCTLPYQKCLVLYMGGLDLCGGEEGPGMSQVNRVWNSAR